jgi:hypothetical protein
MATGWMTSIATSISLLIAKDGATDAVANACHDAISKSGEIVLWSDRTTRPMLINAITADWTRIDIVILTPEALKFHTQDQLKPLFDHDEWYDTLAPSRAAQKPNATYIRYQIEDFIRILGLLPLAV